MEGIDLNRAQQWQWHSSLYRLFFNDYNIILQDFTVIGIWDLRFFTTFQAFSPWIEDKSERHNYAMALYQVLLDGNDGLENY